MNESQSSFTGAESTPSSEMVDKIYTLEEAAEILKISPRTLRGWVLTGKIKAFKMGGRKLIRFHEEDLQDFINQERERGATGGDKAL